MKKRTWAWPHKKNQVCPTGLEPVAYGLEIRCSIQLSYGHINGRGGQTRTGDPSLPKRVRYQLRYAPTNCTYFFCV